MIPTIPLSNHPPQFLSTHHSSGEAKELIVHISLHLLLPVHRLTLLRSELVDDCYVLVEITIQR